MARNPNRKYKRPYNRGRSVTFRVRLTPEERKAWDTQAQALGYDDTSEYIRSLVSRDSIRLSNSSA
jgi:hypothetical protein